MAAREQMIIMPQMVRPDPTPALLLLSFGVLLLVNGTFLILGVSIPMRSQGGGMLLYGALMIVVGTLMAVTNLFPMTMGMLSAVVMYLFGGLMMVSGALMVATPDGAMVTESS
jgi:uncharacterized membrane protein HdeD (DUF308 family)